MRKVKTSEDKTKGQEIETLCSECDRKTYHIILKSIDEIGSETYTGWSIEWDAHFQIIQCQGCKTVSFRKEDSNSEDYVQVGENEFESAVHEQLFPQRLEGRKGIRKGVLKIPLNVRLIYKETNKALLNDLPILSGIGIRAIVEAVCKEKKAKGSNLLERIDDLVNKKLLTPASAEILHNLRVLGNKAAHEVKPHNPEQLSVAMDVIDHLLMDVYVLPSKVQKVFKDD